MNYQPQDYRAAEGHFGVRSFSARNAIVYVTDQGYALPSAASAVAVRQKTAPETADVYIVAVDFDQGSFEAFAEALSEHQVTVVGLKDRTFAKFNTQLFNKTHVPIACVARFFLFDALPKAYERILYLDGDVWPRSDLEPLLAMAIPSGMIAAAEDTLFYSRTELGGHGDRARSYFAAIGIDSSAGYFNSGVLLGDSRSLEQTFLGAFEYFSKHTSLCRYHDQSALNATASDRRIRLSPNWNFMTAYRDWGIAALSNAKLMHFAGGFKPWTIASPYYPDLFDAYHESFAMFASTGLTAQTLLPDEAAYFTKALRRNWIKMRTFALPRRISRWRDYKMLDKKAALR